MNGKLAIVASILDMKGRVLQSLEIENSTTINIGDIPSGQYILELVDVKSGKKVSEKVIVER